MDAITSDESSVFNLRVSKITLKLEAVGFSERLVPINKITPHRILKRQYIDVHFLEEFKSHDM
jgi:hypothetical protein